MKLGERLVACGLVSEDDVQNALSVQKKSSDRIGALLVRMGALSEDALLNVLSEHLSLPRCLGEALPNASDCYLHMRELPVKIDWLLDNNVIAWPSGIDSQFNILAKDTQDPVLNDLSWSVFAGKDIMYWLGNAQDIDNIIEHIRREKAVSDILSRDSQNLMALAEEAPVIELVNNILSQAEHASASDIHIEPEESQFKVRFRVDGCLLDRLTQPANRYPAVSSRIKLIAGLDIAEKRLPQDGRITLTLNGHEIDVRVSTAPCVHGESIVMRLLPKSRESISLPSLGILPDHIERLNSWLGMPNGIVLVTGPTGSGKSTTLYGCLESLRGGDTKIITVEDPVEYQVSGVTQIQAHTEIGYTFARALRAILRQDPDTIMIGEIRDVDTAQIAIQSALTGHLVLSTLHTNDAVSAFTRLVDMGVEPFLVAATVRGVQAQRLVRRLCKHCAVPDTSPVLPVGWSAAPFGIKHSDWKQPKGCSECNFTGFKGRVGIYEFIPMDDGVSQMINENASSQTIRKYVESRGHRSLLDDGLIKASQGETSISEVMTIAVNEQEAVS
ncbi:GspE/PulE family protein [Enterovibrio calviensis]|uniref:GspE/PulE family protein n=1 Tax=Enterovibrio calviensis TaxID=91359 RepID=UPI00054E4135|nr:type II/IV secretion system protein [Enterovibrio calviensis]